MIAYNMYEKNLIPSINANGMHHFFLNVCVYSGLTSIFQSYHDGVWLRQGAQCSLL